MVNCPTCYSKNVIQVANGKYGTLNVYKCHDCGKFFKEEDEEAMKNRARNQARNHVVIDHPCEYCHTWEKPLERHHFDYNRPLDVHIFCHDCHGKIEQIIRLLELERPEIICALLGVPNRSTRENPTVATNEAENVSTGTYRGNGKPDSEACCFSTAAQHTTNNNQ